MIVCVAERVQARNVARMTRWWAVAASGYCLAIGLSFLGADPDDRNLGWILCGTALALTLLPQLFRNRAAFLAACWISLLLISFAAVLPPGFWRRPEDPSKGDLLFPSSQNQ